MPDAAQDALRALRVEFSPLTEPQALRAGASRRAYRAAGGGRERVIGEFLIAAHALSAAERLLTRDRGFYRRCFGELAILDPAAGSP